MAELLRVIDLKTEFRTDAGIVRAVDGVSYYLDDKEIVAVVGESGCGKSVSQLSVMQLIPTPPGKIVGGEVLFEGGDLLKYPAKGKRMRSIRGGKIAMVFQEPMTSLNPVLTIGRQITEMLELHLGMNKRAARDRAIELLGMVGIPSADKRLDNYPHHFSGGMRQRVMIAIALSCNPRILIADEPTTALDVTTQAQLLELMMQVVERFGATLVLVTHNLGIVARYAQRIYVMYAGRIIESGSVTDLFGCPRHPYTKGLLASVPRLDQRRKGREQKLVPIPGLPPNLVGMPPTCAFLPRCGFNVEKCRKAPWPKLEPVDHDHYIACYAATAEAPHE
jgi:oligopeptide/dipeptide ABC transporter ATP-binding protein